MNPTITIALVVFAAAVLAGYALLVSCERFWQRYREAFTERASFNLADMFLFMDPRRLFSVNALVLVLVPLALWFLTGNPVLSVAALAVIWLLPNRLYQWLKRRRVDRVQSQLPDGLMMVAGGMRAGLGFAQALETLVRDTAPPLSQEFALVLRKQHMGMKLEEALAHFNERIPVQDVTLFVSAVNIAREVGGNLAETLALLAETLRRRLIMEGKVRSLTAQGRLQGIVMALLPVAIVGFLALAYPDTMRAMWHTPLGWGVIGIAAVMEYLGYLMCRRIMSIEV